MKYGAKPRPNSSLNAQVFMARDKQTQQIMALKKMKMEKENEGFPVTALRELRSILCSFCFFHSGW